MKPRACHLIFRIAGLITGGVLLYAPLAVFTRLLLVFTGSDLVADAHRICLRMPFEWLSQPWMWARMIEEPLYLIAPLLLPTAAFFFGPVFCGWLCPAGVFPELLSRLVPQKLQFRLPDWLPPTAIRYGVLGGMLLSPFLGGYICCTFCNFTMMQNTVSALFGDFVGFAAWSSFTALTFFLWLVVLGLFLKGGRGWCSLLCPAGAAQGLTHHLGRKTTVSFGVSRNPLSCRTCGKCKKVCPVDAIPEKGEIDRHACNICLECTHVCHDGALSYKRSAGTMGFDTPQDLVK